MGKPMDLTGQRFGKLTAIKYIRTNKGYRRIWECKCDCGNICNVPVSDLRSGHTTSCGCVRANDLIGQRFGRLTVIERDFNVKNKKLGAFWRCKCDCGNEKTIRASALKSGATQSCGCLNKEIISQQKEIPNMIGRKFGKLTVIERVESRVTPSGQKKIMWRCKCECGNEKIVSSQDLKAGHTKSCGCLPTKVKGQGLIDLVGKKFGKLTVLERIDDYERPTKDGGIYHSPRWLCECDCGNHYVVQGGSLRSGMTTNCGCENKISKGEKMVADFLYDNNIRFIREYSFDDLRNKSGNLLRFDFAVLNENDDLIMLIEYQGAQHYIDCGEYGLYQRKYSDPLKREYCSAHNIPLYEIKYDDDIEYVFSDLLNKIKMKLNNI